MIDEALSHNELMLPEIGSSVLGGFFAGLININGQPKAIIVAPKSSGEYKGPWGFAEEHISGAGCPVDGQQNTRDMILAKTQLGLWAQSLNINGFSDWFIPSKVETEIMCGALNPTSQIQDFMVGGIEAFDKTWYWTSTQASVAYARVQHFGSGALFGRWKGLNHCARAVRTISLGDLII